MEKTTGRPNLFLYYIGNSLILMAIAIFTFLYYPILKVYLFPSTITDAQRQRVKLSIEIPKIHAFAPIITNVNPWDEKEYLYALTQGVAHAIGTSLPDQIGTMFLFAHSSDVPWRIARYNTIFLRLGELDVGDTILIRKDAKIYEYHVRETKVVWPTDVSYLRDSTRTQLILQTCSPIGTAYKRLLVFADKVSAL